MHGLHTIVCLMLRSSQKQHYLNYAVMMTIAELGNMHVERVCYTSADRCFGKHATLVACFYLCLQLA